MPRFKKYHWLIGSMSLWLLSLGLHGLVMLVPIPETEDIVEEPEIEIPEAIQVSELPAPLPKGLPIEPIPEPVVIPSPTPLIPAPLPAPVVAPLPPEPLPPEPLPPEPLPPEPLPPEPLPPELLPPEPLPPEPLPPQVVPEPLAQENLPLEAASSRQPYTRQIYDDTLASTPTLGAGSPLDELRANHPLDEETDISMKVVRATLALNFPQADICFENLEVPQTIRLSSGVVLAIAEDSRGQSFIEAIDSRLLQLTGYATLNTWVDQSILPPIAVDPAVDPNLVAEATDIPALAEVDIVNWIQENIQGDILKSNEQAKLFTFPVEVTIADNPCE